jgi:hypothetical protein
MRSAISDSAMRPVVIVLLDRFIMSAPVFWNIAIAVIFAALAATVSGLAGHLAASKPWQKWLFWGSGVVMVVLIGIQTYRNEVAQDRLKKQLDAIQKQTEQPPKVEVNIPPAPKQRAIVALSGKTSDEGMLIARSPERPELGWGVNVFCKNIGTGVTAKKVACQPYSGLIPAHRGIPDRKTLLEGWREISKRIAAAHPQYVDLAPGETSWGTDLLHMVEVDPALNSGDKVILTGGAIFYSDEAGSHKTEFCRWAQAPFNPDRTVWHFCETGHNREIY